MNRYSTLKTYTPLRAKKAWRPKRTKIKIGLIGLANRIARKEISNIAAEMQLNQCELGLPGCTKTWPLAPAHRHKRAWYKGDAQLLAQPDQWVCACQGCHDQIEIDPNLTEDIFIRLRGPETI